MTLKECYKVANSLTQNEATDLIDTYKIMSGIFEWDFSVLDVAISFGYVKGLSYDDLINLI